MNASIQVKRGRQECMDKTTEMDILIEKRKSQSPRNSTSTVIFERTSFIIG